MDVGAIWLPGSVVSPGFPRLLSAPRAAAGFHSHSLELPFIEGTPERRGGGTGRKRRGRGGKEEDRRGKTKRRGGRGKKRKRGEGEMGETREKRGNEDKGREKESSCVLRLGPLPAAWYPHRKLHPPKVTHPYFRDL